MKNTQLIPVLLAASFCLISIPVFGQETRFSTENLERQFNDTLSVGNEAFTEPIERIYVSAAEPGILAEVHVNKGDIVTRDDLLMEMDMTVLEASQRVAEARAAEMARFRAAEVEFLSRKTRYEKLITLERDGAGSPEEVERARAEAEVAKQEMEAIREEAERYRLEVAQYEARMELRRIRSPIDGVIVELTSKPGEYVNATDTHVATVVRLDTLRAGFHIPTSRATRMKQGDTIDVLFRDSGERVTAEIEYVSPITQADSGRVEVDVLIDNSHGELRSGVRCLLLVDSVQQSSIDALPGELVEDLKR
ncbi:MAG: efflux RND transporter periplasmic adaptor subunit [Planctomycetota bacterium]